MEPLRALVERLIQTWNDGDAAAFTSCFAADAIYITRNGDVLRGRDEIAMTLRSKPRRITVRGDIHVEGSTAIFDSEEGHIACTCDTVSGEWLIVGLGSFPARQPKA